MIHDLNNIIIEEEEIKAVKLTKDEKRKLKVIKRLINGEFNGTRAAKMLKVSTRQIRNLERQVICDGDAGIIHKNKYNKRYSNFCIYGNSTSII